MIANRIAFLSLILALVWGLVPMAWLRAEVDEEAEATPPPTATEIRELVASLGAEGYKERLGAQTTLRKLATEHAPVMLEQLVGPYLTATDPDLRARLRMTLWSAKRSEMNAHPAGFVGIQMQDSTRQVGERIERTVQVVRIIDGTAARKNDLRIGDLISAVDGRAFADDELPSLVFKEQIGARAAGEEVELTILRGPQVLKIKLQLGERPPMDLLGYEDGEKEMLESAFEGFLREEAEKRGLTKPVAESVDDTRESPSPSPGNTGNYPNP